MRNQNQRRGWIIVAGALILLLVAVAGAIALLNPRLTRLVESDAFRAEMEKETAKGLHFPSSTYGPIRRTGFFSAATDRFEARDGTKAMTSLDAHGITASFNPLGVFLRRWQLDELHLDGGEVGIQVYEPKPEPSPSKPWYHVFLPDRVYLKRIWSEPADVTWRIREKKSGIFGTRLLITPHGRDFEYQATGGTMKMPMIPEFEVRQTHMLITKTLFSLYQLDLASGEGTIHGEGTMGTRDDKSVDFKLNWEKLPVRAWVPAKWKNGISGVATGGAQWKGTDLKLEGATISGTLRIAGGRLRGLDFLEQIAAVTKRKDFAELSLNECAADLAWNKGEGEMKNIAIEDEGKFRIEGNVSLRQDSLGGAIQLGVARTYLDWLPKAEEVFTRERGGYLWTTVKLSGTPAAPGQDLSPRILAALKETPGSFIGAAFRALGAWMKGGND